MNANIVIPNTTNLRLVIIDGHVTTDPKEPMLSQMSYPIVGWRLTEHDVVPLLPRLVHSAYRLTLKGESLRKRRARPLTDPTTAA